MAISYSYDYKLDFTFTPTAIGQVFSFTYATSIDAGLFVVPEPSSWVLLITGRNDHSLYVPETHSGAQRVSLSEKPDCKEGTQPNRAPRNHCHIYGLRNLHHDPP